MKAVLKRPWLFGLTVQFDQEFEKLRREIPPSVSFRGSEYSTEDNNPTTIKLDGTQIVF